MPLKVLYTDLMRYFLFFLCCCAQPLLGYPDFNNRDDLRAEISRAENVLVDSPAVSLKYAKKTLAYSTDRGFDKEEIQSLIILGHAHYYLFEIEQALDYLYRALDKSEGQYPNLRVRTCNLIGLSHNFIKNYEEAESVLRKGIKQPALTDSLLLADLYRTLSKNFYFKLQADSAIHYAKKGLDIYLQHNDLRRTIYLYNNIGILYKEEQEWEEALQNYQQAHQLNEQFQDSQAEAALLINLGEVYFKMGDSEKAKSFLDRGIKVALAYKRLHFVANAFGLKSELYETLQQPDSSLNYIRLADSIQQTIKGNQASIKALNSKNQYDLRNQESKLKALYSTKIKYLILFIVLLIFGLGWIVIQRKSHHLLLSAQAAPSTSPPAADAAPSAEYRAERVKVLLESMSSKGIDWPQFLIEYEKLFPSFIKKYRQLDINHTSNNLKHCICLRQGLSLKETANMLDVSVNAVKSARNRIKKQLNLRPGDSIQEFINAL
ncbi:MAG: tetratricopeptide repeat protein [Bacteroidota bacterium]